MSRIASRAGVTWGAMQHQFGDKDAIIDAVIDRCLGEFGRQMEGLTATESNLPDRVHAFVERAWQVFKGPAYRAVLEIVLNRREKTAHIAAVLGKLWGQVFGDVDVSDERQFDAQRFTFVLLSGIATESIVVPGIQDSRIHFEVLEGALLRMLDSGNTLRSKRRRTGRREEGRRLEK